MPVIGQPGRCRVEVSALFFFYFFLKFLVALHKFNLSQHYLRYLDSAVVRMSESVGPGFILVDAYQTISSFFSS